MSILGGQFEQRKRKAGNRAETGIFHTSVNELSIFPDFSKSFSHFWKRDDCGYL